MAKETPKIFHYQYQGAKWLCEKTHGILADEMGLGKSAQSIVAADSLGCQRILVICPSIARPNWLSEFKKFSLMPRHFCVMYSHNDKPKTDSSVICSYDIAASIPIGVLGSFDLLILDEAHYLKNPKAKRTQKILGGGGYVHNSKRCWALTGTPAPNHAGELWPLLFTFGVTKLRYDDFVDRYCVTLKTTFGVQIVGSKMHRAAELRSLIDPILLRRKTEDVLKDLPPLFFQDITVEATPIDWESFVNFIAYAPPGQPQQFTKAISDQEFLVDLVDMEKEDCLKKLEAIGRSISTLRRYTGLQKVQAVHDLIKDELENGAYEKIVIFAIHQEVVEQLRQKFKKSKIGAVTIYGATPIAKRTRNLEKFMDEYSDTQVLIANIQAAGTSITLTNCQQIIFIEQDWVPANNAQAAKRCHRIGQKKPVIVRMAGLERSFDQKIAQVLRRKTQELIEIFDKNSLQHSKAERMFPEYK